MSKLQSQQELVLKAAGLRALKGEHYPPHRPRGTPKKQRPMIGERAFAYLCRNPFSNHRP